MRWHRLLILPLLLGSARPDAASAQLVVRGSPDVHLEQGGTPLGPGGVSADVQGIVPAQLDLGPLPDGADVIAYAAAGPGTHYFVLGHAQTLAGGVTAGPRDAVRWDGNAYTLELDGAAIGLPDGSAIDALSFDPASSAAWLSFDAPIDLFGTPLRAADVIDAQTLSKVFDSAAAGVPGGMDVDGVSQMAPSDDMLLSFDVGGTLGGVVFANEDVLGYDPDTGGFTLWIDASAADPDWAAADLDAIEVPEPGAVAQLAAGAALLAALARSRRHD